MTTVSEKITTINNTLKAIKQAIINKGVTPSGNITTYATAIGNISGGGTPSGTTDVELTRISDDNGNEIGTWYMNFEDSNKIIYKVILLDSQYRKQNTNWCSNLSKITNMPLYSDIRTSNIWKAKETATQNTQLILDYCETNGYTSTSCSHCRSNSFTINNLTYYGQLPNCREIAYLTRHYNEFDSLDTSASSYSSFNLLSSAAIWSSSQVSNNQALYLAYSGSLTTTSKNSSYFTCPVLEIPLINE